MKAVVLAGGKGTRLVPNIKILLKPLSCQSVICAHPGDHAQADEIHRGTDVI